jgi:hypothetical protein
MFRSEILCGLESEVTVALPTGDCPRRIAGQTPAMPEPVPWSCLDVDPGRSSGASGLVNLVSRSNEYRTLEGENRDGLC